MRGIVWFKKDLRISDNPALYHACSQCEDGVIAVYIIDPEMWKNNLTAPIQIQFILEGLQRLSESLLQFNIPLLIKTVKTTQKIPQLILSVIEEFNADKLFFNRELELNETKRDQQVAQLLMMKNIKVEAFDEQFILPMNQIKNKQGEAFKVFTAFKKAWLKVLSDHSKLKLLPNIKKVKNIGIESSVMPVIKKKFNLELWPAGEKFAKQRLKTFVNNGLLKYAEQRDFPDIDGTSRLSPYLAVGMISARECFSAALAANSFELYSGNKNILTWLSELIWREFYRAILVATPRICMNKAYKIETEKLPWAYDEKLLNAWKNGMTGFPIVDAAMRQLNTTGWMHNRLRMIAAMFLSKNLFLDWRLGEAYFSQHLIDSDFASNNGGWQWCASTGTDAVPYFRIFNPTTQSERFDPEGNFIRQYCPELSELDNKSIHDPYGRHSLLAVKTGYSKPVINYAESRKRVIAAFKSAKNTLA